MPDPELPLPEIRRRQRRAFLGFGLAGLSGLGGWWWLRSQPTLADLHWPLRRMHEFNEQVGRALFNPQRLAPEFAPAFAGTPRPNGRHGKPQSFDEPWLVNWLTPDQPSEQLSIKQLMGGLPRVTMTTELKCIEGWSQVVTWGGVRWADVCQQRGITVGSYPYIRMATPDGGYTVALDSPSAFHPQTLLCDEMNGETLAPQHGAPLRLVITVKYGIKNIKWLGLVEFTHQRPTDYWTEAGYDWYAGL